MATTLNNYELMIIYTPVLTEEEYKAAQAKTIEFITSNGGEIVHKNPWGLRSLAYSIEKKTTAFYYVIEFKAPSDLNAKMTITMNRDEKILRYMVTVLDKNATAYNERKRSGASSKPAVAEEA